MSATAALILLAEAASACGAVAPVRLGGGAEAVEAILGVELQAFDPSVPTLTGLGETPGLVQGDTVPEADQPEADPAAEQCKAAQIPIA